MTLPPTDAPLRQWVSKGGSGVTFNFPISTGYRTITKGQRTQTIWHAVGVASVLDVKHPVIISITALLADGVAQWDSGGI
jgi:hypothetical protein